MKGKLVAATPPELTTTGPDSAPAGTGTTTAVSVQEVGVALTPLKLTDPPVPNVVPEIVTGVPNAPAAGDSVVTVGDTVN